jgi:hypothetical protein
VTGLYEAGALEKEIARRVALSRAAVTRILDGWFAARGLDRPDGRARRAGLPVKHVDPPSYRNIADRVKEFADRGLLFGEIAERLGVDRNTVTAAWRHWHESRGLPVPDGRCRRKALRRKSGRPAGADDSTP